jgi:hypothetical protein
MDSSYASIRFLILGERRERTIRSEELMRLEEQPVIAVIVCNEEYQWWAFSYALKRMSNGLHFVCMK